MLMLLPVGWTCLGAAVGSFLNVVADRLPRGESVAYPPSRCPTCSRRLHAGEMIPVFSYLLLRGRCRRCGTPIGLRTLAVELSSAGLFLLVVLQHADAGNVPWQSLLFDSLYVAILLLITITDLEHGLIFDRVSYPAVALAVIDVVLRGWSLLGRHLLGGALGAGLIALIILLVPGGMGWGDAKLAGFIGLITGVPGLFFALFLGFVGGGLIAGALLVTGRVSRRDTLPLGPFLALGGAITMLYQPLLQRIFDTLATLF
jgi:prepilin signal peptidase PulO-like enzyme (type II secretory pathway)